MVFASGASNGNQSAGALELYGGTANGSGDGGNWIAAPGPSASGGYGFLQLNDGDFNPIYQIGPTVNKHGWFGATPVGQRVSGGTLAGVIAGLVSLGLFSS
jgi:hypothetical protein